MHSDHFSDGYAAVVEAVDRARELLAHRPVEDVVGVLRDEGFGPIETMSALIKAGTMP